MSWLTIALYLATWSYWLSALVTRREASRQVVLALVGAGLIAHSIALYMGLVHDGAGQLGFFRVASLFFFVINGLVFLGSLRNPMHSLFLLLMPLSIVGMVVSEFFDTPVSDSATFTRGMLLHVLSSILAYSLLTIASLQALLLAYQNRKLKARQWQTVPRFLPPLETIESLMFSLVQTGFVFLTLSIVTGIIFIEDLLAQHLAHKTVFSVLSWLIYGALLIGHQVAGWRGASAVRWVLVGFAALMLAYFGSKFVLEILLGIGANA